MLLQSVTADNTPAKVRFKKFFLIFSSPFANKKAIRTENPNRSKTIIKF